MELKETTATSMAGILIESYNSPYRKGWTTPREELKKLIPDADEKMFESAIKIAESNIEYSGAYEKYAMDLRAAAQAKQEANKKVEVKGNKFAYRAAGFKFDASSPDGRPNGKALIKEGEPLVLYD